MKFINLCTGKIGDLTPEKFCDNVVTFNDYVIVQCLERDSKKVKKFMKEVREEICGLDDCDFYLIFLPEDTDIEDIARGKKFTFYNNCFSFLDSLVSTLEKDLNYYKSYI